MQIVSSVSWVKLENSSAELAQRGRNIRNAFLFFFRENKARSSIGRHYGSGRPILLLENSCESSTQPTIHVKCQALFSLKFTKQI